MRGKLAPVVRVWSSINLALFASYALAIFGATQH